MHTSVRLTRRFPMILHHRSLTSILDTEQSPETHNFAKQYEQACERYGRLEQRWIQSRKDMQVAAGSSPITFPSNWCESEDHVGPFDMNQRTEAQKAVDRHSKYAWVSSFYAWLPQLR